MPETLTRSVQMPAFEYLPRPYDGPSREEVLAARQRYANPALFTLYREDTSWSSRPRAISIASR